MYLYHAHRSNLQVPAHEFGVVVVASERITTRTDYRFPLHALQVFQGRYVDPWFLYDVDGVAGWEPFIIHGVSVGHASWVGPAPDISCSAPQNGRVGDL